MSDLTLTAKQMSAAIALQKDIRGRMPGDSALGISHELCEHNNAKATCHLCIYGEAGNKVIIDMGALEMGQAIADQLEAGEIKPNAVTLQKIAQQAYRAGAAMGMETQREASTAKAVVETRAGLSPPGSLVHVLIALENGQISKEDALRATIVWQDETARSIAKENGGPTPRALES